MITVRLVGGIGNQMFQYAAAKSLAEKLDSPLLLDVGEFSHFEDREFDLHVFPNITEPFCSEAKHKFLNSKSILAKAMRKIMRCNVYKEPHFHLDADFFSLSVPVHLIGHFQSEGYFFDHGNEIRNRFKWEESGLSETTLSYLSRVRRGIATSVHFRRGDYVADQQTNDFHGTCDLSYYRSAIRLMTQKFPDSQFFIFSDDISWVKRQNLFDNTKHTYIEKTADMHDSDEMFLMSQCHNNIVANSSFSWWGAWLNSAPGKVVVAPQNWFRSAELDTKDLVPKSWVRV